MAGFSFSEISNALSASVTSANTAVGDAIANLGTDPDAAQLMTLQAKVSDFNIRTNLQATLNQQLSSTFDKILQKMS